MELLILPVHDPVLIFFVVLFILLVAPLLAEKARLPGVVGLIIAGIIVGPFGLGILERDKTIELLGTIGILYIMFIAGLEIDLAQLKKNRSHSLVFGFLTFAVPMLAGIAVGFAVFGMKPLEAILFGAVFSTQTLLPYPIVSGMGLVKTRSVTAVVGATIITDTLVMLVLAVVSAAFKGSMDFLFWLKLLGFTSAFVIISVLVIPPAASLFFKKVRSDGIVDFVFVLALMFLSGALSKLAGLEPIIGAFLSGLLLNRLIPETSVLMNRVKFAGNALFIPFFLISVGMLVDVRLFLSDPKVFVVACVMIAVNIAAKYIASASTRVLLKYTATEANLLFGLSVNHAAAALAVVLVGYSIGLFDVSVLNGTIVMMLVSCLIGPLVTQWAGKKLALEEAGKGMILSEAPERILVPMANPEAAGGLLDLAFVLREGEGKDPVYPAAIILDSIDVEKDIAQAEKLLALAVVRGVSAGVPVIPVTRVSINVAEGVVQAAKDVRISTILLGWNGIPQLRHRAFGGIIDQVILSTKQNVVVAKLTHPLNTTNHLVAVLPPLVDRQAGFAGAITMVKRLSFRIGAKLHTFTLNHSFDGMKKSVDSIMPAIQAYGAGLQSWDSLCLHAKRVAPTNCAFILVNVRPGRLAWQPALEKLPSIIMQGFKDSSLLIMYLPDETQDSATPDLVPATKPKHLFTEAAEAGFVIPAMRDGAIADAVRELIERGFPGDDRTVHRLSALFTGIAQKEPVELRSGVVLLHAHIPDVEETKVFFGVNRKGFRLMSATESVKIIILLIAPESLPPEEHLRNLADIAKLLRNDVFMGAFVACENQADVAAAAGMVK